AAVPLLKENLEDPSTRAWAAYALLRITGDDDAYLPLLIRGIPNDPGAAAALAELGPREKAAVPALTEALDSPFDMTQSDAAYALGKIGPAASSAVPRLIRLLGVTPASGPSPLPGFARLAAVEALGEIGPTAKDAVSALNALANDDDDGIAAAAEAALAK